MTDWLSQSQEKEIKNLIGKLESMLVGVVQTNARARALNQELLDEHYKDTEMAKMKKAMEQARQELHNGFGLTDAQVEKATKWQMDHDKNIHNNPLCYHGASGGGFEWVFYPTGLGTTCDCICSSCKNRAIKEHGADYWRHLKENDGVCQVIGWEAF